MNLHLVSGLPRSGSTLLINVLGQNPKFHVTPTSGVVELMCLINNSWTNYIEFKSQGLEKIQPRIRDAVKGLIVGFFKQELKDDKIIFDKSRAWLHYVEELEYALGHSVKIIVNVRDPRDIVASFERIYRNRKNDWQHAGTSGNDAEFYVTAQTVEGRCQQWFADGGVIGIAINRLRDALKRIPNRLIIFPYNYFVNNPNQSMNELHIALSCTQFNYKYNDVKQITYEDDVWHGMQLHKVKPIIKPNQNDWKEVIPENVGKQIEDNYSDIIQLSQVGQ